MAPDNPQLPEGQVDAVLVASTYHEFTHSRVVLNHLFQALHSGGRLVIVHRGPLTGDKEAREFEIQHHERTPSDVETELREAGFEMISPNDRDRPALERPGFR